MPEKRLRGNGFLLGKNDMHRFKIFFSTIYIFIICIFRMISSFFSFCVHVPFMAEHQNSSGRPAPGAGPRQRKGRRLPWHRPLRITGRMVETRRVSTVKRPARTRNAGRP